MPSKMSASGSQNQMLDGPSWSTPSASPSPPPPPLPPPVAARWARTEQVSNESCPHCRGRLASLPTRTTSLSSYSCKDYKCIGIEIYAVQDSKYTCLLNLYGRKSSADIPEQKL